ncbi:carbohydrate ABC transporter membrane protein 1, CUT1 family [Faunimonas pinastri]|uniref:Carbohydrate ABC transporter membrane protein 1, CUT1 family n=1 Tax=Faunimonas pinastri TaxID=1855383 RepID=A0A1H9QSP9_9HYPH|nr:sugar ABC transporter permease [Faunimonas pinastri]SER63494.1 carbohydrate ABC transporter membrane protein 1, CUT1 family [Faunimonas pinastri]
MSEAAAWQWGRPGAASKPRERSETGTAFLFLLPSLLGLIVFLILPLLASLVLSFTNWQMLGKARFIGISNYVNLLTRDPTFYHVLWNTLLFTVEYVILNIALSLAVAVWISSLRWGKNLFRLIFFLPTFTPLVGLAIVWLLIFTPGGMMDWIAGALHLPIPNLLTNPNWALQAVVLVSLWSGFGYNLLLFSASLDTVPPSYLEAAQLDGAGAWRRFWSIKLPLISPTLFFGTVMTAITSLQIFDQVYALTRGGPGVATATLGFSIYRQGFGAYHMGYAAAISWVLFLIIMGLTALQFRLQRRWVHYDA